MRQRDTNKYAMVLRKFNEHYTGEMVLAKFDLLKDAVDLHDQFSLCCPFHDDILPSFRLSKETGEWHCFGCGAGGQLFKLLYMLDGSSLPFDVYVDNFLKNDPAMKKELGFSTIFLDSAHVPVSTFIEERKKNRFKPDSRFEMPISSLARSLKRADNNFDTLSASLEMLQGGIAPNEVYKVLMKVKQAKMVKNESDTGIISLSDLII